MTSILIKYKMILGMCHSFVIVVQYASIGFI